MLNLFKFALIGLLLLHSRAEIVNENSSNDESVANNGDMLVAEAASPTPVENAKEVVIMENDKLKVEPMPLLIDEKEGIVKEIAQPEAEMPQANEEKQDPLLALAEHSEQPAVNRTGRQLFYSPNFFYIQNIGAEGSKCVTSRGLVGICMGFNKCSLELSRRRRQLTFYNLAPQYAQFTPYVQQDEICTFFDQYARTSSGVCCTSINTISPVVPAQTPQQLPVEPATEETPLKDDGAEAPAMSEGGEMRPVDVPKEVESSEDTDVLEPPADFANFQPEPPKYDNTDNSIGYDPVDENLKQAQVFNDYIRYPWPSQFVGFSGVQQWPPPLPTHPPSSVGSWPPQIPTHPPNHHYPTHPPAFGGQFTPSTTKRPITSLTTKRPTYPSYPSYPTYRPVGTTTTTTTTTRRPIVAGDAGGVSSTGLPLQCGMKNVVSPDQERIVGGTNASPHEFPWIAVMFKSGKQFCGGSLITNNHVLTAAHCVARMTSWDVAALTVHLGDYNIRTDFEVQHISRRVKRLVRHKGFDFSTLHNDIAILTLSEPVKFTQEIQPICLPTSASQQSRSYSGHVATVAGWGSLRENGPQPSILQKVDIPIWNNAECASKYGRAAPAGIIESMVCAGQAAKDSCSGDSGGPMIVNDGGRYVQVGIVSWGIGCGKGQYPGVYTRVTSLLPWIYKNIK